MILFRIPIWAWPSLLRYSFARRLSVSRRPPAPELSESISTFFWVAPKPLKPNSPIQPFDSFPRPPSARHRPPIYSTRFLLIA